MTETRDNPFPEIASLNEDGVLTIEPWQPS